MTLPVAGWYPDPDNTERSRWWNGMAWTDNYVDNASQGAAGAQAAQAAPAAQATPAAPGAPTSPTSPTGVPVATPYYGYPTATLSAPAGTAWSTVWIWLIVIMPLFVAFSIFAFDFKQFFTAALAFDNYDTTFNSANAEAMFRAIFSPGIFLLVGLAWLVAILNIVFAYFDWRELKRRGVPQPFHWAWSFLQYGVYPIGRSVVANRRIGKGLSPLWATIIVMVVSSIIPFVYVVLSLADMPDLMSEILRSY